MFYYRSDKTIANCSVGVSWPLVSGDGTEIGALQVIPK